MDFSKSLMRCSTIGYFMVNGKEKTPKQVYEATVAKRDQWVAKYDALDERLKSMATGKNTKEKIEVWNQKVRDLEPTKNDEPLPKTAKSYLKRYYSFLKYGKWSASLDKGNKFVNKGKLAEEDSIDLLSKLEKKMLKKNEQRLDNDLLTGVPDIIIGDDIDNAQYIYDIKTSWDAETFFDNLDKELNPYYWWQMQGYLALTNCQYGEVSFCLVNTPEGILNNEKYRLFSRMNVATEDNPEYKQAAQELVNNMTFDDMPIEDRKLTFLVERDDEAIDRIYKRVELCREYLAKLEQLHLQRRFETKSEKDIEEVEEIINFDAE